MKEVSNATTWHRVREEFYNPHLTIKQNQSNGCEIPTGTVLIMDCDKPRVFCGSISYDERTKRLVAYESLHGSCYGGVTYLLWSEINYPTEEEQKALYEGRSL